MDIRSVQKTGDMYYLYLPKVWCKENKIVPQSKVSITYNKGSVLSIFPHITEEKPKKVDISVDDVDDGIMQKLIVACYLNPLDSFKIHLTKDINFLKVMEQKRVISLENIEFDKNAITCDSIISISNPMSLLKTMVKKIKNMIDLMLENFDYGLLRRYEEEIDRSTLLIEKAVIDHYSFTRASKLKSIDLHYVSWISRTLERVVDELMVMDKKEVDIKKSLLMIIADLYTILENIDTLDYKAAIQFIKKSNNRLKDFKVRDLVTYSKLRIKQLMDNISDTIIDWAITKEVEKK